MCDVCFVTTLLCCAAVELAFALWIGEDFGPVFLSIELPPCRMPGTNSVELKMYCIPGCSVSGKGAFLTSGRRPERLFLSSSLSSLALF